MTSLPFPQSHDDYVLVKTIAMALKPTDWQTLDQAFKPGTTRALSGCDAAGIVVKVGKRITKDFKEDDRIAGAAHGGKVAPIIRGDANQ